MQCDCMKPMLYRVKIGKEEDIEFCTAASDKVCFFLAFLSIIMTITVCFSFARSF